jgi:gliding motility-associated-like protein
MAAGSYTITVTHTMSGCMASTTTAIPEPNPIDIQATPKQVSCTGLSDGEINVTVTGGNSGFQYEWSHGPTTEDLTGLAPGSYTLMVTDSKGCEATSTAIVITDDNDVAFQISYDSIVNSGDSPELSPFTNTSGYNFTWRVLEATNVTIAPSPNAQNSLSNGATILHTLTTHDARSLGGVVYEFQPVKISNPNCKAKADTVTVLVRPETDGEPFIPEIYTPNGDGQNDYWNLTMPPDVEIGKYTIFNRLGGQVFEADIDTFWDGNLCPDGPYIYVLRYTQNGVEKIVKGIVTIIRTAK